MKDLDEAAHIYDVLAAYDRFQLQERIKPDYSNAGGLQTWDGEEWIDWHDSEGNSFDDCLDDLRARRTLFWK